MVSGTMGVRGLPGAWEQHLLFWNVWVFASVSGGGLGWVLTNGLGMWGLGCLWWQVLAPSQEVGLFWASPGVGPGTLVPGLTCSLPGVSWVPPAHWVGSTSR